MKMPEIDKHLPIRSSFLLMSHDYYDSYQMMWQKAHFDYLAFGSCSYPLLLFLLI